jgi:hypothetical protein
MSVLSWSVTNSKERPKPKNRDLELSIVNMPAFHAEDNMPPADDYIPEVKFFYSTRTYSNAEQYWQERGRQWNSRVEHFIGEHREVEEAARAAIGAEADPENKLRLLYVRAQSIRNLSYERDRTDQERKAEKLKSNDNAADVLARGFGTQDDITLLFAALARSAGFQVSLLRAANRREHFFNVNVLSERQLPALVVRIDVGGKEMFFQPGVKYCPFAILPWTHTSTRALLLDKKGGSFISIPGAGYDQAITTRKAAVTVSSDGSLKGRLTVEFQGQDALQHRLSALNTDEAGRAKDLENEVNEWLGNTATVKLLAGDGWEGTNEPLKVTFQIEMANFASSAGKRMLVPAIFFQTQNSSVFKVSERKYPVYFPYAYEESDWIQMEIPAGFSVETVPEKQSFRLPYAAYQAVSQQNGTSLVNQRVLVYNGVFVEPGRFSELKDFFAKVQNGDQAQVVLRSGSINAQKTN